MTIRINGAVGSDRLGYLQGEQALVAVVVRSLIGAPVALKETGVLASLADFKTLYAFDKTADIAAEVTYNTGGAVGSADPATVPNTSVEQRTFNGVVLASDAAYVAAHAAQHNLRVVVDTIQQRAVIIAASQAGIVDTALSAYATIVSGYDKDLEWDDIATVANSFVVLIERADVMDKYPINTYGQISGSAVPGGELIAGLTGIRLLNDVGAEVLLTGADFAVKVSRRLAQII